jgi:hypothetical protein
MLKAAAVLMVSEFVLTAMGMTIVCPEAKPVAKVTSLVALGRPLGFQF